MSPDHPDGPTLHNALRPTVVYGWRRATSRNSSSATVHTIVVVPLCGLDSHSLLRCCLLSRRPCHRGGPGHREEKAVGSRAGGGCVFSHTIPRWATSSLLGSRRRDRNWQEWRIRHDCQWWGGKGHEEHIALVVVPPVVCVLCRLLGR